MTDDAFAGPKINERLTRDVPMRRIGRPEEIGPLAVLLASSASDFLTGQTIFLAGGHSAAEFPRRGASPPPYDRKRGSRAWPPRPARRTPISRDAGRPPPQKRTPLSPP